MHDGLLHHGLELQRAGRAAWHACAHADPPIPRHACCHAEGQQGPTPSALPRHARTLYARSFTLKRAMFLGAVGLLAVSILATSSFSSVSVSSSWLSGLTTSRMGCGVVVGGVGGGVAQPAAPLHSVDAGPSAVAVQGAVARSVVLGAWWGACARACKRALLPCCYCCSCCAGLTIANSSPGMGSGGGT